MPKWETGADILKARAAKDAAAAKKTETTSAETAQTETETAPAVDTTKRKGA